MNNKNYLLAGYLDEHAENTTHNQKVKFNEDV